MTAQAAPTERPGSISPPTTASLGSSPPSKLFEPPRAGTPSQALNPALHGLGEPARPSSRNTIHVPQPPPTLSSLGGPPSLNAFENRTQLFVGNLPFRVRWQDCKDLFRKCGTVLRADVALTPDNRSKGYGTVLFASREDAQRAIDTYAGFNWQSRVLDVRIDQQDPHGVLSMQMAAAQSQLPPHHAHLLAPRGMVPMPPGWSPMPYGMGPPPQFPGVPFPSQASQPPRSTDSPAPSETTLRSPELKATDSPRARDADGTVPSPPPALSLNGGGQHPPQPFPHHVPAPGYGPHGFYGQPMMVPTPVMAGPNGQFYIMSPYYPPPMQMGYPPSNRHSPAPAFANRTLFVGNLPFSAAWQELKDLMRTAGNVQRADVTLGPDGRSRGFGTVVFATPDDAQNAMRLFNGFEWQGRTLKVHFDKYSQNGSAQPSPMMLPSHGPSMHMPMAQNGGPLVPPQVARQSSQMSNGGGTTGDLSVSTETNSPPPITPLASPMYAVPPFLPGPIGPPHPYMFSHTGHEDGGPKLGSAALMSPPVQTDERDPFSQFAQHSRHNSNAMQHPHSITIPSAQPLFGPMSPQQSRVPMTPSMPAFSFGALPTTPPLLPQFLSPGLGPFSPPLSMTPGYSHVLNRTPFLNAAPGAPVHVSGQASFSSFGSYFPDVSAYQAELPREADEADEDDAAASDDDPGYFPPVSSLLARRASSNVVAKDLTSTMTLSPTRREVNGAGPAGRSVSDSRTGRSDGAAGLGARLLAPEAETGSVSAPSTAFSSDFAQRLNLRDSVGDRDATEADAIRRRASFTDESAMKAASERAAAAANAQAGTHRHLSGSGMPKGLEPIRVEARARFEMRMKGDGESPRRASFDVSDPAQARTLGGPSANVWDASPWAYKPSAARKS